MGENGRRVGSPYIYMGVPVFPLPVGVYCTGEHYQRGRYQAVNRGRMRVKKSGPDATEVRKALENGCQSRRRSLQDNHMACSWRRIDYSQPDHDILLDNPRLTPKLTS